MFRIVGGRQSSLPPTRKTVEMIGIGESKEFRRIMTEVAAYWEGSEDSVKVDLCKTKKSTQPIMARKAG